jgi:DNA-binding PadR family transcriptional regulator
VNGTRLFALSALARGGPMHGYQIRRAAKLDRTELWTEVKPGSLYGALHRMAGEGLVEVVRTEREGNPPEHTVYAITTAGRQELPAQRDAVLREVRLRPDPVDLALSVHRRPGRRRTRRGDRRTPPSPGRAAGDAGTGATDGGPTPGRDRTDDLPTLALSPCPYFPRLAGW